MANFFSDNSDLKYQFSRLDLEEAVRILEHDYKEAEHFPEAPQNYQEAQELYEAALELVGELAGDVIAPLAMEVDAEGAHFKDGKVTYAKGTREALDQLAEAGLMGVILPRKYGGIEFPATIYMMMIEMISRADASLMTMFGYQDVGEAIARFGSEEVASEYLPKYTSGEHTGAMVLSEPSAGSDLQAVKLQAYQDDEGNWFLKGVKHFISNGCGDVLLVLARSEPNTTNIFGLSLFACHGGDKVRVTRIEEKMGLHGSPTCELYFDDAPAKLVGRRRQGLLHVLYVLNHARFSVASQGLGIAEAAYAEAVDYAAQRKQFGKVINTMPSVANLLIDMRVSIEAHRSLLYAGAQWLDLRNRLEDQVARLRAAGEPFAEEKERFDEAANIVDLLSPMVKYVVTEAAYKICYDAQQVHGGMGYMREMAVERLIRDVRITTIYEGTSQVQIIGSSKGVFADALGKFFDEHEKKQYRDDLQPLAAQLRDLRKIFQESLSYVAEHEDAALREVASKELVDMYASLYTGYLVLDEAETLDRKKLIARRYISAALSGGHGRAAAIRNEVYSDIEQAEVITRH